MNIVSWLFSIVFLIIGVLNLILVHPLPGLLYFLLALVYLPQFNVFIKKRFGYYIPTIIKLIVGIVVLWGTLAVGDLAEILGL